jgi:hypothetical protein
VINVEWSGFGGEWSAKCRVEWFRRGSINVEWSVIGEVGSCTAPYTCHISWCARHVETTSKSAVETASDSLPVVETGKYRVSKIGFPKPVMILKTGFRFRIYNIIVYTTANDRCTEASVTRSIRPIPKPKLRYRLRLSLLQIRSKLRPNSVPSSERTQSIFF